MKGTFTTKKIAGMAMLAALSIVFALFIRFPLIPTAPFLEYDAADIPIFLGTFMYGPFAGLIITVVVSIIQGTTVSAGSGFIGILMHIFATGSYVLVAGLIYQHNRKFKGALLGMLLGSIVMVGTMILWNIIFTPIFLGLSREIVYGMLLPAILPFNLAKATINSAATILLYKRTHKLFNLILKDDSTPKRCKAVVDKKENNENELPIKED